MTAVQLELDEKQLRLGIRGYPGMTIWGIMNRPVYKSIWGCQIYESIGVRNGRGKTRIVFAQYWDEIACRHIKTEIIRVKNDADGYAQAAQAIEDYMAED